jgi:hypothetical protein
LSPRLYPPGLVYHIFSENKGIHRKYNVMEESVRVVQNVLVNQIKHPSLFGDIVISQYMFLDHMPDLYEDALGYVVERLSEEVV